MRTPKRFWTGLALAVFAAFSAAGINTVVHRPVPVKEHPAATGSVTDVQLVDAGRKSEHFQIADDSLEGDAAALGNLEPVKEDAPATEASTTQVKIVATNALVTHVADGDTFDVTFDTGEEARIRMLGIDTPETVDPRKTVQCFGKEASDLTKSLLMSKRVRLDADPNADERDKYGRLLRNVTLEDDTDYNAELVREVYAHAYLSFPLNPIRKKQLADLQKEAQAAKRGLWADDACQ